MKQTLIPEIVDHPSTEAETSYRSAIKLLARTIVQTALTEAHRELGVSKPLPFSMTHLDDPSAERVDQTGESRRRR